MKRTLLEILGGLAVLVLLASFHHQIARLQANDRDVAGLRDMVARSLANAGSREEITQIRQQLMARLEGKLRELETRISEAAAGSVESQTLKKELHATRGEVDTLRGQLVRDVKSTRELFDNYQAEVRAQETAKETDLRQTRSALASLQGKVHPDPAVLTRELLSPTVQLNGDDTVGSGTIVFSGLNTKTNKNESWVLTSFHVIRNILADSPSARRDGIAVTIYQGSGKVELRGDMMAHDEKIDAALMKLRTEDVFPGVARVMPRERTVQVKVWDAIYAVGCPLGNDPIPTEGAVSSTRNELNGSNYWMINAPTYFGNSGGGVFLADSRELVGVFSKIYTHGKGNPVVVPHMGLCTPIGAIHEWAEKEKLEYVLRGGEAIAANADVAAPPGK